MNDLTDLSYKAADQVEELASDLHMRVQEEIGSLLRQQLKKLGVDFEDNVTIEERVKRILYPDDPKTLAVYQYDGKTILAVKIGPNGMSITFDVPEIKDVDILAKEKFAHEKKMEETQNKTEVQT